MTDEEEMEKELKMKKLMTVAKSKYYMLKVNHYKVFEKVDFEAVESNRLETDLQRETKTEKKSAINVSETSEDLNSEENIKMRE